MRSHGLNWKMFVLIVVTDVADSVGELLMKKGLLQTGISSIGTHNLVEFLCAVGTCGLIWLGVSFYVLNFLLWITVLSRVDLSVAAPAGSTSYLFVPFLAIFFLSEHVGFLRWAGIILIIGGIHLVSRSGSRVHERPAVLEPAGAQS